MNPKTPKGSKTSEPTPTPTSKPEAKNDPWYSKVVAKTGNVVSGGAALLVRTSAMGGMQAIVTKVATAAVEEANQAAKTAYVSTQGDVIGFPNEKRRKKRG
ncbi:hypothetical protein [Comamonas sp.]|uniref:hypothetical protein n=1 Tax=Comamonas sp. TaxID=34028 RepID=UPI0012C2FC12|nr:hypothetical protein [Comamonas sp.]MPS92930.1 hypothetical protein [Comamonas sp.]